MANLTDIEGVGQAYAEKLQAAGLTTTEDLLDKCCTPQGRKDLAENTGIREKLVLRWANHADLFRVKGIGEEYADLLEASGVDTVPELGQRNSANLREKMAAVNEQKKLTRQLPAEGQVTEWIEQAKGLPRMITH